MNQQVESCVGSQSFEIRLGNDESFPERATLHDPVVTGRQVLQAVNRRPEKNFQLLLLTSDGELEEIRLDETIDLRRPGVERFFVFESDRLYAFEIDDRRFFWGCETVAEHTLKFLAGVASDYTVWQERRGEQDDLRIEPGSAANLADKGVEVFFTGKDQTNAG